MKLDIEGIEVDCIIGDLPEERMRAQRLIVDAALVIDDTAASSDALADTADYVAIADAIRRTLVDAKCKLIERAARIAADACIEFAHVSSCEIKVTKRGAVPGIARTSATCKAARGLFSFNRAGEEPQKEEAKCSKPKHWWNFSKREA